jgi:cholesterol transport system auxiliary component
MRAFLLLLPVGALAGCALLGKSAPVGPRYYTPEYEESSAPAQARSPLELRLGRIEGGSHLRERMVMRTAGGDLVYDEARSWTERPEVFLRQALERDLFERRGLVEVRSGRAVTLDVELTAFEEVAQPHHVRLRARVRLADDRIGLLDETIIVERPILQAPEAAEPDRTRALVETYAQALREGVTQVSDDVVKVLAAR